MPGWVVALGKVGGMAGGDTAGSPGSSVTPGFGICPLQEGNAGSRDSTSRCAVGFFQAGFLGFGAKFQLFPLVLSPQGGREQPLGQGSAVVSSDPEFLAFPSNVPKLGQLQGGPWD